MNLTSQEIREKTNNKENFILDCFADWCYPCKKMLPHLETASNILKQQNSTIGVYKYNIDSDREFSASLGVMSIPTIKVFKDGKEIHSQSGVMTSDQLINLTKTFFS